MEDIRVIDLKDYFFYLCLSWRQVLLIILISALLAGGITRMQPVKMTTKEAAEKAEEKSKIPDDMILTPPPYSYLILDPDNPYERYDRLEVEQMLKSFSTQDPEARLLYNTTQDKIKENQDLQETLDDSPFLKIDPSKRVNKQLRIKLNIDEDSQIDLYGAAFLRQNLCSAYLGTLRGQRFYQTMAENYAIQYKSDEIRRLIQIKMDTPHSLFVKVTAPDEEQRELLYKNCKEEIQRIYDEGEASYIKHDLVIDELPDETVRDSSILVERQAIEQKMQENQELIEKNQKEIRDKFYEDYRNEARLDKNRREREKLEALTVLQHELGAAGASEEDLTTISDAIKKSSWDAKAVTQIKDAFYKSLTYDKKQEKLNLEKQVEEAEKRAAALKRGEISEEEAAEKEKKDEKTLTAFEASIKALLKEKPVLTLHPEAEEEIELVPVPRRYKRNVFLGLVLGIFLSALYVFVRYWKKLSVIDLPAFSKLYQLPSLGAISLPTPLKKRLASPIDRWICRLFGKEFKEDEQTAELILAANAILAQLDSGTSKPKLLLSTSGESREKEQLFKLLEEADTEDKVQWAYSFDFGRKLASIEEIQNADAVLFVETIGDFGAKTQQQAQIARNLKKNVLGLIELKEKYGSASESSAAQVSAHSAAM